MPSIWQWMINGYLRVVEPFVDYLVRKNVRPNTITTIGTVCACVAGLVFASGHIRTGGWILGITAVFDLADGMVARRTNRSSAFGAFYDSTLDRIADGFLLGGLTFFFASSSWHRSLPMVGVGLLAMLATFVTSYARARAELVGVEMKGIGMMERAERITLLSAPQAFFGLALDGLALRLILSLLAATAIVTAWQRIMHVRRATEPAEPAAADVADGSAARAPMA